MAAHSNRGDYNVEILIEQVRIREALWNRYDPNYHAKKVTGVLWNEVASMIHVSPEIAKQKWKNLRDTFRIELRKGFNSNWALFHQMYFIKDHMRTTRKLNDDTDPVDPLQRSAEEKIKVEPPDDQTEDTNYLYIHRIDNLMETTMEDGNEVYESGNKSLEEQLLEIEKRKLTILEKQNHESDVKENDSDYLFLMSLLPEIKKLDPDKRMLLRIKLLELVYKEVHS